MRKWFKDVWDGISSTLVGMNITWSHLFRKKVTLHYPEEKWTLPPRSRMRLFMKYEDCIGCGQCARACPVSCIYIKAEKRPSTSPAIFAANGQPIKLDVHVFDIDMSLCCYCNLCTYPCPTDCIYMTPEYEFATDDITNHLYHFAKPNAKFLTVNPKAPAAAAARPAAPAAAATPAVAAPAAAKPAAATPAPAVVTSGPGASAPAGASNRPPVGSAPPEKAPSPGTAPQPPAPGAPQGAPNNPEPDDATGTPPAPEPAKA